VREKERQAGKLYGKAFGKRRSAFHKRCERLINS
jgi:hypothetical protein